MGILICHPIGFDMADGHSDFAGDVHGRANDFGHDARSFGSCLGPAHAHAVVGIDWGTIWTADIPAVEANQGGFFHGQFEADRLVARGVDRQGAIIPGVQGTGV